MTPPVRALGIAWYNREDYPRILKVMEDANLLPPTYDVWRAKAEAYERAEKAKGVTVIRAIIDPEAFPAWCAIRGLNINAEARTRFANEHVQKQVGRTH